VAGGVWLAAIGPDTAGEIRRIAEELCGDKGRCGWVGLDATLDEAFVPTGNDSPTAGVLWASVDPPLTGAQMRQAGQQSGGKIRFYLLGRVKGN